MAKVPHGLQPNAARGAQAAIEAAGFSGVIGGLGNRNYKSDHAHGNAIDLMTGNQTDYGWDLANWYWENRDALGLKYIIFDGKIASASRGWQWRPYSHPEGRTDGTAMHRDHVHVSFRPGASSNAPLTPFQRAGQPAPAVAQPVGPPPGTPEPVDPRLAAALKQLQDLPTVHAQEIAAGRLTQQEADYREAVMAHHVSNLKLSLAQKRQANLAPVHQSQVRSGLLSGQEAAARNQSFAAYVADLQREAALNSTIFQQHQLSKELSQLLAERRDMQPTVPEQLTDETASPIGPRMAILSAMEKMAAQRQAIPLPQSSGYRVPLEEFDPTPLASRLKDLGGRQMVPSVLRRSADTAPARSAVLAAMTQMTQGAPPSATREESLIRLRR